MAWLFDRRSGPRRRHVLRDRTLAAFRRGGRRLGRVARGARAKLFGLSRRLAHLRERPKELDDATLASKVKSKVFRDPAMPKGLVDVNAEEGIVYLRGEVPTPDLIRELVERTRRVRGVRGVENLLHLPSTQAPMHQ